MWGTRATTGWKAKTDCCWWNMHQCWNGSDGDIMEAIFEKRVFMGSSSIISCRCTPINICMNPLSHLWLWVICGVVLTEAPCEIFWLFFSFNDIDEYYSLNSHTYMHSCTEVTHQISGSIEWPVTPLARPLGFPTFEMIMTPESHNVSERQIGKDQKRFPNNYSRQMVVRWWWMGPCQDLLVFFTMEQFYR